MIQFIKGQRWMSETEPELGLGIVVKLEGRRVRIFFPDADLVRLYAMENAPVRRVLFHVGDRIQNDSGTRFIITSVKEKNGLCIYYGDGQSLPEQSVSGKMDFNSPLDRLMAGQFDPSALFALRLETLEQSSRFAKSPVYGFHGPRVNLIPHQFYIAEKVVQRRAPRVLLSDETGLGKTIEAGLILHRLFQEGRVIRALIITPDALVVQWFVEMVRRFNLMFTLFDREHFENARVSGPGLNPYLEDPLGLCSIDFLTTDEKPATMMIDGNWDMLIVDEAHHLEEKTRSYEIVRSIAEKTKQVLLLTATPEQLGIRSHFARLKILDSNRHHSFELFRKETTEYQNTARTAKQLISGKPLGKREKKQLHECFSEDADTFEKLLAQTDAGAKEAKNKIIDALVDRHGPGRIMFRNTRSIIKGFPDRNAVLAPIEPSGNSGRMYKNLEMEFELDNRLGNANKTLDFTDSPRMRWLVDLIKQLKNQKILLICRSREKAIAIHKALGKLTNADAGLFHEGLSLVQRDRNAAWFAQPDGADILICSEIGSEGRNFQFAGHLVLFDLPMDPELIEQRIGRLDRIGQAKKIDLHIPYVKNSVQEMMALWYHHGLGIFKKNIPGSGRIMDQFQNRLLSLAKDEHPLSKTGKEALKKLIKETAQYTKTLSGTIETGRDRLLEMNSFHPEMAAKLIRQIKAADQDTNFDLFSEKILSFCGLDVETVEPRTFTIKPGHGYTTSLPGFRPSGITATCDRKKALEREEIQFLTMDHPMIRGAMDYLLGSSRGNSAATVWVDDEPEAVLLETIFVLEAVSPPRLNVKQFLPPTPVRVLLDHTLTDQTARIQTPGFDAGLNNAAPKTIKALTAVARPIIAEMIRKSREIAEKRTAPLIRRMVKNAMTNLGNDLDRLVQLKKINPDVREEEIRIAEKERDAIHGCLLSARLRLDAVRLIRKRKSN